MTRILSIYRPVVCIGPCVSEPKFIETELLLLKKDCTIFFISSFISGIFKQYRIGLKKEFMHKASSSHGKRSVVPVLREIHPHWMT